MKLDAIIALVWEREEKALGLRKQQCDLLEMSPGGLQMMPNAANRLTE